MPAPSKKHTGARRRTDRTAIPQGAKAAGRKRKAKAKPKGADHPWMEPWLKALEETRSVSHACQAIGIARSTVYDHRDQDETFRQRWEAARYAFRDDLEASALTWAIDGLQEPVFGRVETRDEQGRVLQSQVKVVGVKLRRNAAVTLRMLECLFPERYGRDQGDSDPHEAARSIREDLVIMAGAVPVAPPPGLDPRLVEPAVLGDTPRPPGQAARSSPTGEPQAPAPVKRARAHEPEPPS